MTLMELRDERPHWSYSSLNCLLNVCSLQWAFERHWKLPPEGPVSAALVTGSAYHRCLELEATARMNGEAIQRGKLPDLFTTLLERQVEQDGGEVDWKEIDQESAANEGRRLVQCHIENIDPEEQVVAVNHTFCTPLVDAQGNATERPLVGEADCVVENGKRTVVDWKTSKTRYSSWKVAKSMQGTAMLYGVRQSLGPVDVFRFDLVVKLKRAPAFERYETTRNQDDYHRLASLALMAEKIVKNETFHPCEGGFASPCGFCRYKAACKAWHRDRERLISVAA